MIQLFLETNQTINSRIFNENEKRDLHTTLTKRTAKAGESLEKPFLIMKVIASGG